MDGGVCAEVGADDADVVAPVVRGVLEVPAAETEAPHDPSSGRNV